MTVEERDACRALWFERFEYQQRETAIAQAFIGPIDPRTYSTWNGSGDAFRGLPCRTAEQIATDALVTVQTPIRAPRQHVSLISPQRFLAWIAACDRTMRNASSRIAPDFMAALSDVSPERPWALVDVDRVAHNRFAVTPRDAVPHWETRDVKPYKVRSVKPFAGTPITEYGRLEPWEFASPYVAKSMVPMRVYLQSTADPMAYSRYGMKLLRDAETFLSEHGERMPLPDRYDTLKHRWSTAPDRAAYRGQVRFKGHAPMRYEHGYTVDGYTVVNGRRVRKLVRNTDKVNVGIDGQFELETRLTQATYCRCGTNRAADLAARFGAMLSATDLSDAQRTVIERNRDAVKEVAAQCSCEPRGWIGLRFVTFGHTVRSGARAAQISRERNGIAPKGPNVTPWSMSARSLTRASKRVADAVTAIEATLRSSEHGSTVRYGDTVVTIIGTQSVYSDQMGRAYSIREFSQRAALARFGE